ncbi:symmetrical bis(5'-nucleosyl)-tetraphosphatase [Ruminobacter amylophilus]|uniref:symmetrical bis(5'-nucleosyl)-tetraphosphatase n=1 Tax=Ruminobacter amylophilus TaxID=867 RepID=UPI003863C4D3
MSVYFIGDVHACFHELQDLLNVMEFNPNDDELVLTGDIIGRGPHPLETIEYVRSLGDRAHMVLGNHDLNLLAVIFGHNQPKKKDNLSAILKSSKIDSITDWLRKQPLLYIHPEIPVCTVHAGITPQWNIGTAISCAREMEQVIRDEKQLDNFLSEMYSDDPSCWFDNLSGISRLRYITNVFTRIRLCYADKSLDFKNKNSPEEAREEGLVPWFDLLSHDALKADRDYTLVFGHWAALTGKCLHPRIKSLDTGCVWGNRLTGWCYDTDTIYSVPSRQPSKFDK